MAANLPSMAANLPSVEHPCAICCDSLLDFSRPVVDVVHAQNDPLRGHLFHKECLRQCAAPRGQGLLCPYDRDRVTQQVNLQLKEAVLILTTANSNSSASILFNLALEYKGEGNGHY